MEKVTNNSYDVCIIVVSFNSKSTLKKCISSIFEHAPKMFSYKVMLVDNASIDGCLGELNRDFPDLDIIVNDKNLGFGAANNIAMNRIDAKFYYLHNVDAYLKSNVLDNALEIMNKDPSIGIAGLPLVFPDFSPQTSAYSYSTPTKWILQIFQIDKMIKLIISADIKFVNKVLSKTKYGKTFVNTHAQHAQIKNEPINFVDWVCGASMIIRKETKIDVGGGFDENIFLYGEDEDICLEASKKNWKICQLNVDSVIHEFGWGKKNKKSRTVSKYKYNSLKVFINKHYKKYSISWAVMRIILSTRYVFWSF